MAKAAAAAALCPASPGIENGRDSLKRSFRGASILIHKFQGCLSHAFALG
jgi:hypothetical protein